MAYEFLTVSLLFLVLFCFTNGSSLEVIHRHGPCFKAPLNHTKLLSEDQSRVDRQQGRLFNSPLPVQSDGSALYLVQLGLGTPKKIVSLVLDTVSSLTWVRCEPRTWRKGKSSTFQNVSCGSQACKVLRSSPGFVTGCSDSTCLYRFEYNDSSTSSSAGIFAIDKLTVGSSDVFDQFYLGCGQKNQGSFGPNGSLGLADLDKISFLSQTGHKYGKYFSYCLPSEAATGHLSFGRDNSTSPPSSVQFTPLVVNPETNTYRLSMDSLFVDNGDKTIKPIFLTNTSIIIDSRIFVTSLPPAAYTKLKQSFRAAMSGYPLGQPYGDLETCYNFTSLEEVKAPVISFVLRGDAVMNLHHPNYFYVASREQICLAIVPNKNTDTPAILGNFQQKHEFRLRKRPVGFCTVWLQIE